MCDRFTGFANNQFIARIARDESLIWQPGAGTYDLLVVDDLGRSHSRTVSVLAPP